MYQTLFSYFEEKSQLKLSEAEKSIITNGFNRKKLKKKQFFLQSGDICYVMGFIVKGSSRMYSIDKKGQEHILKFALEGWWTGDYESHWLNIPSLYNVEMLEDSEILTVTNEKIRHMIATIPSVDKTVRVLDQRATIAGAQRMHAAISMTAEERYDDLSKAYPEFLIRFPQNMIASYLGVTPETLSRIKKNIMK